MKRGDPKESIEALQKKVIALGYPLPRYGADGDLAGETISAVFDCITDLWPDMFVDDYMDPEIVEIPDNIVEAIMAAPVPARPDWLYDVTKDHPVRNAYSYRRKVSSIDSITLHQTACNLSESLKRWHFIRAHIGVTRLGKVIRINTNDVIVHCSNWFNHRSIGFEISGNFRGVESRPETLWKGGGRRHTLTDAQVMNTRRAVELCCDDVARAGGKITTILGHRQANDNKRACPGEDIWKKIGLWAQAELGLVNDPNYTKGSGVPIPNVWDPRSDAKY